MDDPNVSAIQQILGEDKQSTDPNVSAINDILSSMPQTPDDVSNAQKDTGDQSYNGLCQAFVEQMTQGRTGIFPSAIAAYEAQKDKVIPGLSGVRPGDVLYFSANDSNEGNGHTGIAMGNGKFISATDNGIMPYGISDWLKRTGQQILGYLPK